MTYEEAVETEFSREEARREIDEHDCEGWDAFVEDVGDKPMYTGQEVLDWLGY